MFNNPSLLSNALLGIFVIFVILVIFQEFLILQNIKHEQVNILVILGISRFQEFCQAQPKSQLKLG